jgi:UDP-N-acetylmuramoyl-L-alanyl-D-glutamate--2,6-diaminopimelate ligase
MAINLIDLLANKMISKSIQLLDLTSIESIEMDSRLVRSNTLFVAIKGVHSNGHDFIEKAIEKGAVAIVCEELPESLNPNVSYIQVENSAKILGQLANTFFEYPSQKMTVVGVTGTKGKTTTASLLFNLYTSLGFKCGLLSTIEVKIGDKILPSTHTTPDAISIQSFMREMVNNGCTYCFMEVSSHAIDQYRIEGIEFDGAIFTNITHDHLDYHKTFSHYLDTKKRFFDDLKATAIAITNIDDKNGNFMLQNTGAKKVSYALKSMGDYRCSILDTFTEGMSLKIEGKEIYTQLSGEFNAYNILAVYAMASELGMDKEILDIAISKLKPIQGRFQTVISHVKRIVGIVDYAHTPDALEKLLFEAKRLKKENHLITVVGCGGNRDKEKRPKMAQIACEYSDKVLLTSDNPRNENPVDIIKDMKEGLDGTMLKSTLTIVDRQEAIRTACMLSETGDIIVIAGKGHETYQEIQGIKYDFDDRKVLELIFNELGL